MKPKIISTGILMCIFIITKIHCDSRFVKANFRCKDGKYVLNTDFCDNTNDCHGIGSSDESNGCSPACGNARFQCEGGPCIDIANRCDTIVQCPNGDDEWNCGDETDIENCEAFLCKDRLKCIDFEYVDDNRCNCIDCSDEGYKSITIENRIDYSNCTFDKGKHLCHDKLICLDFKYTCNGVCGCFDCSDETSLCSKFDSHSCRACPHSCLPTPGGPQCATCNSSNYETSPLCREIENCTGNSYCSQYCSRYKNVTRCLCNEDHHEIRTFIGILECQNNVWLEAMLIYSTISKIKMKNVNTSRVEIIQNDVKCTALAPAKNYIYYVTSHNNKDRIRKTSIIDRKTDTIIELDLKIKSLAVDWISSNIYFTANKSLLVCSNDGRICTRLKCCVVNYIGLASKFGRMFYTQDIIGEDRQMIMKSNMDGSEESAVVDRSFDSSISLAVDEWTEKVYWFEAVTGTLHSASLDGSHYEKYLLSEKYHLKHFSSLERYTFFVSKLSNAIYLEHIPYSFASLWHTDEDTNDINELFAYNPLLQSSSKIENPCENSSCHGLCLLRAASLTNGLNSTCMCDNFIPVKNNPWCGDHPNQSILQLESFAKTEVSTESSTKPFSTSMKNELPTSTKASTTSPVICASSEKTSSERYITIGMSSVAFAFSALLLYLHIRNNYLVRYRQSFNFPDRIEL